MYIIKWVLYIFFNIYSLDPEIYVLYNILFMKYNDVKEYFVPQYVLHLQITKFFFIAE